MRTLTPHGKILVQLADELVVLGAVYGRLASEADDSPHGEGWVDLYVERKRLDDITSRIAAAVQICRSLSDEVLAEVSV